MRKTALGAILVMALLSGTAYAAGASVKASATTNTYVNSFQNLFKGWFASTTKLAEKTAPGTGSESLFGNINGWFRAVTGIGLDQILLAIWKLLIWILTAIFTMIWNLVLWMLTLLGR